MSHIPSYIKISNKKVNKTWVEGNPELLNKFVVLGEKLAQYKCTLYLIGSAAGTEEIENVGDIDIVIFVQDIKNLSLVELETRPFKHLEGTSLTIRFQFYPKSFLNPYKLNTGFNPVYYTAIKTINYLIYGQDVLNESNWLDETGIKDYARNLAIEQCLMTFRVVNKQKWTSQQNSTVMQKIIDILLNLMFYKGYFGYSKTEIYSLVNKTYNLKNKVIPELMLSDRISRIPTFYEKEPPYIQTECLRFCQELLELLS